MPAGRLCFRFLVVLFCLAGSPALRAFITGFPAAEAISRENRARQESLIAGGVDAGTGAFLLERPLLSVQGGREITFAISYNSLLTGPAGPLGRGWSHTFEAFLEELPNGDVTVHWDVRRKNTFRSLGGGEYEGADAAVRYDKLRKDVNSRCNATDGAWQVTTLDGTVYEFDSSGRLTCLGNKVFQFLELSYDNRGRLAGVREPLANRFINLRYSKSGDELLESLQDAEDRVVFFNYDGQGRLREIRDPVTRGFNFGQSFSGVPIPDDDPNGVERTIFVDRTDAVGLVIFNNLQINHDNPSDLRITLISPSGTTAVFRNNATMLGSAGELTGAMTAAFDGENPNGEWRLVVRDEDLGDGQDGFLNTFRLVFTEPADPTFYTYNGNLIEAVHGPDFQRIAAVRYDGAGRVIELDDGVDTNEPARFSYQPTAAGGVLTTYIDRAGETWLLDHDADYNLLSATDPLGNTQSFEYDPDGNRTRFTNALGRSWRFRYDAAGNLETATDPEGAITTMAYDSNNNVRTITDALGRTTTFQYNDNRNNVTAIIDAMGHRDNNGWGGTSQMRSSLVDDGGGVNINYTNGHATEAQHPVSGTAGADYDNIGRPTEYTDGDGFPVRMEYDTRSEVVRRYDQLDNLTVTEFDRRGRRTSVVSPRGGRTEFVYDGNDNIVALTNAEGATTTYAYDGEDRLVRETDPLGNSTAFTYDAAGNLIAETDPLGNTTRFEYDAAGNQTALINAKGVTGQRVTYDARDLPVAIEDALGAAATAEYDAVEKPIRRVDALGRELVTAYDDLDRPVSATDELGRTATKSYGPDDVVEALTPASGNGVSFSYDPANRMTRITNTAGFSARLTYNRRDLPSVIDFPSGRKIEFAYNEAGQVTEITPTGALVGEPQIFLSYDANGNLTTVESKGFSDIERQPSTERTYDLLNRVTSFTDLRGDTIGYQYDAAGNLVRLTYPDGLTVRYAYDAAGRLTRVTDWANRVTEYAYDANGNVTRIDFPNGTTRLMDYDAADQVIRRRDLAGDGTAIVDYRFSYDAAGQITSRHSGVSRPPFIPAAASMTYSQGQVLATYNGQPVVFNNDGFLTEGPLGNTFATFRYDSSGNLFQAGGMSYQYDAEDRLVGFSEGGATTQLTVNPLPDFSQVLVKRAPNGTLTRYVWGLGLIYEETNGAVRVHHHDQRGSTAAFSGNSGNVAGSLSYGPFGELGETAGDADSLFLFGSLFGVVTTPNGLNHMRFRWYSPQIKRFLSPDPIFGDLDDPGSLNPYAYAGNNPISRADPNGQFWNIVVGAAVGAVVGVAVQAATDIITGKQPQWEDYAIAAVGGALSGALVASCGACGLGAQAAIGAFAGAVESSGAVVAGSLVRGEEPDPAEAITAGLIGGALGGLGGAAAGRAAARGAGRRGAFAVLDDIGDVPSIPSRGSSLFREAGRGPRTVRFKPGTEFKTNGQLIPKKKPKLRFTTEQARRLNKVALRGTRTQVKRLGARLHPTSRGNAFRTAGNRSRTKVTGAARRRVNRGRTTSYGEHRHYQLWGGQLTVAGRPVPNTPRSPLSGFK